MNLSKMLGLKLKDDDMLEVLEGCGVEKVVYDFDRTHENEPDRYWAGSEERGFLLRFNEDQVCDVVFCYIQPSEGFSSIEMAMVGVPTFPTFEEAERYCITNGLEYSVAGPSMSKAWLRIDGKPFRTHFQFKNGALFRVTLSSEAPR